MTDHSEEYWNDIATQIVRGEYMLTVGDLKAIAYKIDFGAMKPEFLPPAVLGNLDLKIRRRGIKALIENVWGMTESDLISLEHEWLKDIRLETGSSLKDDKDDFRDLVAPQILSRIYATAYLIYRIESGNLIKMDHNSAYLATNKAVYSLNLFLLGAVFKGWSRSIKISVVDEEEILYNFLIHQGLPVAGSGLFLPNPEVSLPYLFSLFRREALRPEVYK